MRVSHGHLNPGARDVEFDEAGANLRRPDPRLGLRELSGTSWTVGVLFRPAAASVLGFARTRALIGTSEGE